MPDPNCCPDCGELLVSRRGIIPLTGTLYCPACSWCEVLDGKRQKDAKLDWHVKNVSNRDDNIISDEDDENFLDN